MKMNNFIPYPNIKDGRVSLLTYPYPISRRVFWLLVTGDWPPPQTCHLPPCHHVILTVSRTRTPETWLEFSSFNI